MANPSECDECRDLKSSIWRQLKAFKVLTALNPSLSSSILVENLRSLVTDVKGDEEDGHHEVNCEVEEAEQINYEHEFMTHEPESVAGDDQVLENVGQNFLKKRQQRKQQFHKNYADDPTYPRSPSMETVPPASLRDKKRKKKKRGWPRQMSESDKKRRLKDGWGIDNTCSFHDKSRVRRVKLDLIIGRDITESLSLQKRCHRIKKELATKVLEGAGSPNKKRQPARDQQSRLFVCDVCSKSLKTSTILTFHKLIHTKEYRYSCTECDRKFIQLTHLKQHIRGAHTGERPYQCVQCPMAFFQQCHLNQHIRAHNDERPYQCKLCEAKFRQLCSLNSHILSIH